MLKLVIDWCKAVVLEVQEYMRLQGALLSAAFSPPFGSSIRNVSNPELFTAA